VDYFALKSWLSRKLLAAVIDAAAGIAPESNLDWRLHPDNSAREAQTKIGRPKAGTVPIT
jgi:hypothetical protein